MIRISGSFQFFTLAFPSAPGRIKLVANECGEAINVSWERVTCNLTQLAIALQMFCASLQREVQLVNMLRNDISDLSSLQTVFWQGIRRKTERLRPYGTKDGWQYRRDHPSSRQLPD